MKLCRFDASKLGIVEGAHVRDVTKAKAVLPQLQWPLPHGDVLISHLPEVIAEIARIAASCPLIPLADVRFDCPVANPSKIFGAAFNYSDHEAEVLADPGISQGHIVKPVSELGLFLKAGTALIGPSEEVIQRFPDRRNDHEIELVAVIGKTGSCIPRDQAMEYVAGYMVGLDMTVRGPQFQCMRKSVDTYAVAGPWLVTADEIADPHDLDLSVTVNGQVRQASNTRYLKLRIPELIEFASSYYTLYPGDLIYTGTPAGVGPVLAGDEMHAVVDKVGDMRIRVRAIATA
jgi:2-keto-4-pentenoate hydratase/2-oxohepta-3-ene-1,7-dioic acid hydratase in catechol pathway